MLRELLWRDWILARRELLINAALFAAFEVYFALRAGSPRFFLVGACLYAAIISTTIMTKEDRVRGGAWSCSFPVSRKNLVTGRFVGGWLFMTVLVGIAVALGLLLPKGILSAEGFFRLETLFLILGIFTLTATLLYPFTIRFGLMGILVFAVTMQLLGAVVLMIAVAFPRPAKPGTRGLIGSTVDFLKTHFTTLRDSMPPGLFYPLLLAVLMLINWTGYRVAVAVFRRKEF